MSTTFAANTDKATEPNTAGKKDETNASMQGELLQRETKEASHQPVVQTRLAVGATDDPYEKEADSMADKVMRMPAQNFVQRKCADCEEEEKLQRKPLSDSISTFIQTKSDSTTPTVSDSLSQSIQSSRGGGSAMDGGTQSFMSSRFNTDFSDVKIHTGSESAQMNKELNAKAFTVGSDIYFNEGQYQPGNNAGKHLLAHELTHTIQQGKGIHAKRIQRAGEVGEYSNSGFIFPDPVKRDTYADTSANDQIGGNNYWYQKIKTIYEFKFASTAYRPEAMAKDGWDIILSKAWEMQPATTPTATTTTPTRVNVFLPITLGASSRYRVHCLYTYSWDTTKAKPLFTLDIKEFIAEGASIADINSSPSVIAKKVPRSVYDALDGARGNGFPASDVPAYFKKHPEVQQALAGYIEYKFRQYKDGKNKAALALDEIVSAKETNGGTESKILIVFKATADRDSGFYNVNMKYFSDSNNTPTAGYNTKDYADFRIEKDKDAHKGEVESFGGVRGLDAITDVNEKMYLKNQAVEFYINDKTGTTTRSYRDTEVDQIIPFSTNPADPTKTEFTYYTFIIHKPDSANLIFIDVKKLGKKGDATIGDPSKPLITRVPGYAENAFDANKAETPDKFKKWILARYKGVTDADITAATIADITTKINTIIETRSGTPAWFKSNYSITILTAAETKTRMNAKPYEVKDDQLVGLKAYSATELNEVELSLQRFDVEALKRLKDLAMFRQTQNVNDPTGLSGLTYSGYSYKGKAITSTTRTVALYDAAFSKDFLFAGGAGGINNFASTIITHELGHVMGNRIPSGVLKGATVQDAFNAFYKALSLTPITAYAKDTSNMASHSPDTEYFPEALMLFMNDPEWLLTNQFQTYFWFMYLQRTGNGPSLAEANSMIATWESQKAKLATSGLTEASVMYALWKAFFDKKKAPNPDHITTLVTIISEFQSTKQRPIRMDEAGAIVTKWLAFVTKNNKQPTAEETRTFFP